jgi:hypothetical protein
MSIFAPYLAGNHTCLILFMISFMGIIFVDVASSDICDEDREKRDYVRSISRMNTVRFRLVQTLLESNSHVLNHTSKKFELPWSLILKEHFMYMEGFLKRLLHTTSRYLYFVFPSNFWKYPRFGFPDNIQLFYTFLCFSHSYLAVCMSWFFGLLP